MNEITITKDQRHAAIKTLGLDPDLITSITLGPQWASVMVADVDGDGKPRMVDGALVIVTHSIAITDPDQGAEQ